MAQNGAQPLSGVSPPRVVAPARVLLVDGHDITRAGLRSVLDQLSAVRVVAEAASAAEALAFCRREMFDLVVTGLNVPGCEGVAIIAALRSSCAHSAIIALSSEQEPQAVIAAIQAGATAYLLRDSPAAALAAAVQRVLAGEAFVDRTLAGPVIKAFALGATPLPALRPEPLTPREIEVLRSISRGRSNKEIAFDLKVAMGTVKIHVERILNKLAVANRAEATMQAVRLGILDPDEQDPRGDGARFPGSRTSSR